MPFFPVSGARRRGSLLLPLGLLAASAACLWNFTGFVGLGQVQQGHRMPRASPGHSSRPNLGRIQMLQSTQDLSVNDDVSAMHPEDENWYPGVITKANDDGTYEVTWDDPEGGDPKLDLELDSIKKLNIFKDYKEGDYVNAVFPEDGNRYPGEILKANKDGTFQVKWEDPDGGPEDSPVKCKDMRKLPPIFKGYKEGDEIEAVFPDDGVMYSCKVLAANKDGTFKVKWDDPDGGPEESDVGPKEMRFPPIPIDQLEVGQKHKGFVRSVRTFGAFIDIGAEGDGLLHISRISNERISEAEIFDHVQEGEELEVWISSIRDDGKFGLTLIEGQTESAGPRRDVDLTPFADTHPEAVVNAEVMRVQDYGAFCDIELETGEKASGLLHVSRLTGGFVDNVYDIVAIGDKFEVHIDNVDLQTGRISLSKAGITGGGRPAGGGGGGGGRAPQDVSKFADLPSDQWIKATVASIQSFGAFVNLKHPDGESSADALVHITQIKNGYVDSVADELSVGQEVDVWVMNVDTEANKISCSMRFDGDEGGEGGDEGGEEE